MSAESDRELIKALSSYGRFYFRPSAGEQIHTDFTPRPDGKAAICGRVLDERGAPVPGALALLFLPGADDAMTLISRFITDGDGHFIFGPLEPGTLYLIKVFRDDVKLRELEIRTEE